MTGIPARPPGRHHIHGTKGLREYKILRLAVNMIGSCSNIFVLTTHPPTRKVAKKNISDPWGGDIFFARVLTFSFYLPSPPTLKEIIFLLLQLLLIVLNFCFKIIRYSLMLIICFILHIIIIIYKLKHILILSLITSAFIILFLIILK